MSSNSEEDMLQAECLEEEASLMEDSRNEGSVIDLNELSLLSNHISYQGTVSKFAPKSFASFPKHWYQTIKLKHKISKK
jgi:hypothetical protein